MIASLTEITKILSCSIEIKVSIYNPLEILLSTTALIMTRQYFELVVVGGGGVDNNTTIAYRGWPKGNGPIDR